jgi:hypothetical protein
MSGIPLEVKATRAFELPSRFDIIWTDAIGDPALVVNTAGIVVSCNKEAAWLLGRSAKQVVGRRCAAVVRGCLPTGELIRTADCPLVQGWGVQSGPPAVEMLVPGAASCRTPARGCSPHPGQRHTWTPVGRAARLQAVQRIAAERPGARHMVRGGEPSGRSPGLSAPVRRGRRAVTARWARRRSRSPFVEEEG